YVSLVLAQQLFDLAIDDLLPPVDALCVPAQQDLHAVACAGGDLGRVDTGVEPGGQRRVPQVVRTGSEWRGHRGRRESERTGLLPDAVVRRGADHSPTLIGEQPPVLGGTE